MRRAVTARRLTPCLVLAALAVLAGCRKPAEEGTKDRPPVPVRVAKAEVRALRPSFEVIGTVLADPERLASLTAAASGLVEKLAVREGTRVEKGALVVLLDERKARTDLARAEAAYARLTARPRPEEPEQARGLVSKMEAALTLAGTRLKEHRAMRASNPSLVPEVMLLEEQRNEATARAEVAIARATLQLLDKGPREEVRRESRVEVDAAKLQLEFCRVTTPFAGEVTEVKARVGQRADVGTVLATILDTREVIVQARVPGNQLAFLVQAMQPGSKSDPARVRSQAFPTESLVSSTAWLVAQTEGLTGDVPIKLRVLNAAGKLRVGMTVQVELFGGEQTGVAIPDSAFTVNEDGKHVVTLIKDGKARPTVVELTETGGAEVRAGGWIRVFKGLEAGDVVAVENGYGLPENTPVTESEPKSPGH